MRAAGEMRVEACTYSPFPERRTNQRGERQKPCDPGDGAPKVEVRGLVVKIQLTLSRS
jgi:hypothetical protein